VPTTHPATQTDLPIAVTALLDGRAIPGTAAPPHLVQTHISWVVVADQDVYKLKKPVSLGFLDFSTLEKRLGACLREVELNRRLCHDVYLGVRAVCESGGQITLAPADEGPTAAAGDENGTSQVLDYAVWMRRLPEDRMLDVLLERGEGTTAMMHAIADRLAVFHATAATGPGVDEHGTLDALLENANENFEQTRPFIGRTIDEPTWTAIRQATLGALHHQRALFEQRVADGRIRDGHGDLHASNICMTDPVAIFDCIEFNDRFRAGDVASEVAFLAMDLEHLGHPELAWAFVERYHVASGDQPPSLVLDWYLCYRAYVRGKVESMQLDEPEISEADHKHAEQEARRYFALAHRYADRMT
jgi:aminoglycoside phosphotransferase family enzyme